MNLIKLSYFGTNKPTLVNINESTSIYRMTDNKSGKLITKINFNGQSYIMVNEDLETIYKLVQDSKKGIEQEIDWTEPIEEMFVKSYEEQRPQRNYQPRNNYYPRNDYRDRNYNNHNTYNQNSY